MGFETVILKDIKIQRQTVPVGAYLFQLQPGAKYRTNQNTNAEELNIRFDVVEGDFQGKPVYVSYPDPASLDKKGKPKTWSAQALKKLEVVIGHDALEGEGLVEYFNRVATDYAPRIKAQIVPGRAYVDDSGTTQTGEPQFGIFTVAPAA